MKEFGKNKPVDANIIARLVGSLARGADVPAKAIHGLGSLLPSLLGIDQSDNFLKDSVSQEGYGKVNNLIQERKPLTIEDIYRSVEGLQGSDLSPRSTLESYGQNVLERSPIAILASLLGPAGVAGIGPALQSTAAGGVLSTGAKEFGFSPLVQDIAQIAGEGAYGAYKGRVPTIKSEQKQAYRTAKEFGSGESAAAHEVAESLGKFKKDLRTVTDKGTAEKLKHVSDRLRKIIHPEYLDKNQIKLLGKSGKDIALESLKKGHIDANELLSIRKNLYHTRSKLEPIYREHADTLISGVNKAIDSMMYSNPEFYKNAKLGDKLTSIKHMSSGIKDFVEKWLPSGGAGLTKNTAKIILGEGLGRSEKFFKSIIKEPVARQHYFNIAKAAYDQNPSSFAKALNSFAESFYPEKEEKLVEFGSPSSSRESLIEFGK